MRGAGVGVLTPVALVAAAGGTANADVAPQPIHATFKRHDVLAGDVVPVSGQLLTHERRRNVLVQESSGHGWHTVARATTDATGRFRASFRPRSLGRMKLRVWLVGLPATTATIAGGVKPRVNGAVVVYRASQASWYGPGLYGGRTACGGTLNATTLGVANRTLPCGTRVTFRYNGRSVTARVIDRGPFVSGREWDLTPAVKARLRFPSTGTVWATA